MKKIILGIVIGIVISFPIATYAWANVKPIYSVDSQPDNSVSVFDDGNNKCYVVKGRVTESRAFAGYGHAISCLKK